MERGLTAAEGSSGGGAAVEDIHGINGFTPEETMRHMGQIASPGMVMTERTIVGIQESKAGKGSAS